MATSSAVFGARCRAGLRFAQRAAGTPALRFARVLRHVGVGESMALDHIISAFYFEPWGILPERHDAMGRILERHLRGEEVPTEEKLRRSAAQHPMRAEWGPVPGQTIVGPTDGNGEPMIPQMQKVGPVAIIPVFGTLGRHLSFLALWCGGCDYAHVEQMAQLAEADPAIETVIFYFRTPGGQTIGCEEAATRLAAMQKRTVAFSDEMCASCGEWLASACDEKFYSPSAIVGSTGVFIAALDDSKEWENMGWKREMFRSGPLKGAGASGKVWTDMERASMQARVDEEFAVFSGFLKARRPNLKAEVLDGAWFAGRRAVELGLSDGVVASLDEVVMAALG